METILRDRQRVSTGTRSGHTSQPRSPQSRLDGETEAMRYCELGKIRLEMGRYGDALAQFEQALALHPHDVDSWYHRAEALACLNRYDEALTSLEQAQVLAEIDQASLWVQKAVILLLLNRPNAALVCCNHALWVDPEAAQAWLFRGVALHRLGRVREAHRSYQRVSHPVAPPTSSLIQRLCHDLTPKQQAS